MAGGNILALQKILGHRDLKMTLIYAHLALDFLGREIERVSFEDYGSSQDDPPQTTSTRPGMNRR